MNINTNISGKAMQLWLAVLLVSSGAHGQGVRTPYCTNLVTSVVQGSDSLGCYYDVKLTQGWTAPSGCNIFDLPHGLSVGFTNATVSSAVPQAPVLSWLASTSPTFTTIGSSSIVYWN